MTHLGSAIWSYTRRAASAILWVHVPATMSTSACRGEKRAMSNLLLAVAMNSMAQHDSPSGSGHRLFLRAQSTSASTRVTK